MKHYELKEEPFLYEATLSNAHEKFLIFFQCPSHPPCYPD